MRTPNDAELRRRLIAYRERVIIPADLGPRTNGLLRRSIIDLLVEHKPATRLTFERAVPKNLIALTTPEEIQRFLPGVLNITRQALVDHLQQASREIMFRD